MESTSASVRLLIVAGALLACESLPSFSLAAIAQTEQAMEDDRDGDGVPDEEDAFPDDADEWLDSDFDGIGNNADVDDDNDGVEDDKDIFPLDPTEWADCEGDGIGDNSDPDDDNDGVDDVVDSFPRDATEWADADSDGLGDNADRDDDNDGVKDALDIFPNNSAEWADSDSDGVGDQADLFPFDANRTDIDSYRFMIDGGSQSVYAGSAGDIDGDGLIDFFFSADDGAYLVASSDRKAADAADGSTDRSILLSNMVAEPYSWKLVGSKFQVSGLGDVNGDGAAEVLLGDENHDSVSGARTARGAAWVISTADLGKADASDGRPDGVAEVDRIVRQPNSWRIDGVPEHRRFGNKVVSIGDFNSDGSDDFAVNSGSNGYGALFLISGAGFEEIKSAGTSGTTNVDQLLKGLGSYKIVKENEDRQIKYVASHQEPDGGTGLLILSKHRLSIEADTAYWISTRDLAAADEADGMLDGIARADAFQSLPNSWEFNLNPRDDLTFGVFADVDGDGLSDLILSGFAYSDPAYFIPATKLDEGDAADGESDGVIDLSDGQNQEFVWSAWRGGGFKLSAVAGDIDGDGLDDFTAEGRIAFGDLMKAFVDNSIAVGILPFTTRLSNPYFPNALYHPQSTSILGDASGDGLADFGLGSSPTRRGQHFLSSMEWADPRRFHQVEAIRSLFLISGADFTALNLADGSDNLTVNLQQVVGDADGDGITNLREVDDDDDGVLDFNDHFPDDPEEWSDSDSDGIGDNADAFPHNFNEQFDTDKDGIGDRADEDTDGDGVSDESDFYPLDWDNDGLDDFVDTDDDNDGLLDTEDAFRLDPSEQFDHDNDGLGDQADTDDDNDGVPDRDDAFPLDPNEQADSDGDGVGDSSDNFVHDPAEWLDSDGDGVGNNADADDDNDQTPDREDPHPLDPSEFSDRDGDGVADGLDFFPDFAQRSRAGTYEFKVAGWQGSTSLGSAGDFDRDGLQDSIIAVSADAGAVYLISSTDIEAADAADGLSDRVVDLNQTAAQPNSWKIVSASSRDTPIELTAASVGDADSDGLIEILVGAPQLNAAYLISTGDLSGIDASDGRRNGVLHLENVASARNSWELTGESSTDRLGGSVGSAGDSDGDGLPDFFVSAVGQDSEQGVQHMVYILSAPTLAAADDADGTLDGRVGASHAVAQQGSWELVGESEVDAHLRYSVSATPQAYEPSLTIACAGCAGKGEGAVGAVYHFRTSSIDRADSLDGKRDGVISMVDAVSLPGSWKFVGTVDDPLWEGTAVGDIDHDGVEDLLIGSQQRTFFVSGGGLSRADEQNGNSDGVIELHGLEELGSWNSSPSVEWTAWWEALNDSHFWQAGVPNNPAWINAAKTYNRLDGSPTVDVASGRILVPTAAATYALGFSDLASAAGPQGVNLAELPASDKSLIFVPPAARDWYERRVAAIGDADGDDVSDIMIGTGESVLLVSGSDLSGIDASDGEQDRILGLSRVSGDADQDGYEDIVDRFADDPSEWADSDGDGVGNNSDAFPQDDSETADWDGDGIGDSADIDDDGDGVEDTSDAFPFDPDESADTDGDGVGNNSDVFPENPAEWTDTDGDGVGNNTDVFPQDPGEWQDSDGDGVGDNTDAFPEDASETLDSDGDGIGDVADGDDDGDGVPDERDLDPLDPDVHLPNASFANVQIYQGPLTYSWDAESREDTRHLTNVIGRKALFTARVIFQKEQIPEVEARVQRPDGTEEPLERLTLTERERPQRSKSGQWETNWVFKMPGHLFERSARVIFELDPDNQLEEYLEGDNELSITLDGQNFRPFKIKFIPIRTTDGEPSLDDIQPYMRYIHDFYPIADDYSADIGDAFVFEGEDWSQRAAAIQLLHAWNVEADEDEFWHGLFEYPLDGSSCGHAFFDANVAVSGTDNDNFGISISGCPSTIHAHEMGHNFGLDHVLAGCGEGGAIDYGYPYRLGAMGPERGWFFSDDRFVGPDDGFFDVMSYCRPKYISDYHYRKAFDNRLKRRLNSSTPPLPTKGTVRPRSEISSSAAMPQVQASLAITGQVSEFGVWSLYAFNLSRRSPRLVEEAGEYYLKLFDSGNSMLHEARIRVIATDHDDEQVWVARLPLYKTANRLTIEHESGLVLLDEPLSMESLK